MRYAAITERLAHLGGAKWEVHARAKAMQAAGIPVIQLTIGEPDVATPAALIAEAQRSMRAGRLGYSNGRGELALLEALAARYTVRTGRPISTEQIACLPGTQTALYTVLLTLTGPGDEVLVGDPLYATYEGLIASTGATVVRVPLRAENGFRMQAEDVAALITPQSRVLFLNTPHNPTGAILTTEDIAALGDLAKQHDLWIVSDEVYEELVFQGGQFASPFDNADLADRVVVAASISKSHAAPGFRSGWCVGPEEFSARLLPVSETMLFGNQPFIADMTAMAVSQTSEVARGMAERFARRAGIIYQRLHGVHGLRVHRPDAGMFTVIDVNVTQLSGEAFAGALLAEEKVAVMPGESFGAALAGWIRVSLTQDDSQIAEACDRIIRFTARKQGITA
ncbi:pyridoxal phosphate-dependent aminotransferase [Cypionkella sp.]|uniref:pyridoxal phosphate-dependent aminotransferase n=1 Tax=Cypionkella sp. TaxID=2811411 RepID=UPI002616D341|nr:pyridoxal phosphate-dependent aminotransferase [Cypionkella sp.]MDB5666335.1 aminotransferase [Cypionkella sp.]